ncbi:MAG TPA: hypothetical protein VHL58_07510 [Thermoanaerobaculia bacterium]|nr:hypothetical protein [Thermoanaerobaculia bacterium]
MESGADLGGARSVSAAGYELFHRTATSLGTAVSLATDGFEGGGTRQLRSDQRVSAILSGTQLIFDGDSEPTVACSQAQAELRADLADIVFPVMGKISLGTRWSDSLSMVSCVAGIPGAAVLRRHFEAVGDTTMKGERAVVVQRGDSITARANGALGQHALTVVGGGHSTTRLYVSEGSGKVLRAAKGLVLRLVATTASRSMAFVEMSTSVVQMIR